jgi:ADP-ribose pyrophosphatase YjhB (NUDIX family)
MASLSATADPSTTNDVAAVAVSKLPRLGSAVIVLHDDSVLLGVRNKDPNRGRWVLPGGKVEPFESIEAAAVREVREETGLDIAVERQLGAWEIINPPEEHRIIVYSLARPVGGQIRSSSELGDVRFWPKHELVALDLTDTVRGVLDSFVWD